MKKAVLFLFILIFFPLLAEAKEEKNYFKSYALHLNQRINEWNFLEGWVDFKIKNSDKKTIDLEYDRYSFNYLEFPRFAEKPFIRAGADVLNEFDLVIKINDFFKHYIKPYTQIEVQLVFDPEKIKIIKSEEEIPSPQLKLEANANVLTKKIGENKLKIKLALNEKISSVGVFQESQPLHPILDLNYSQTDIFNIGLKINLEDWIKRRTIVYLNLEKEIFGLKTSADYSLNKRQFGLFLRQNNNDSGVSFRFSHQLETNDNQALFLILFHF
ncbi:MAG: hypothetical protein HYV52_00190 [Parcubacteria group bacterium]|nr:hypothetical protein [Parcubacteria group bacterium]